jgi:N-dimethylarginine dimethylaminohydrolase
MTVVQPHPSATHNRTPHNIEYPAFLLNIPTSFSNSQPNNAWVHDYKDDEGTIDQEKALRQWLDLYSYLSANALVYVLPTPPLCRLQDLTFVGNLGIVLHHLDEPQVLLSHFNSEPRRGEEKIGGAFFTLMGYHIHFARHLQSAPDAYFEGEAELKHLYDNVYVGGYGQRSAKRAYELMERRYNMRIITLEMTDEYLYHLDCTVFPLTLEKTLVCTEMYEESELEALAEVTEIVDVSVDDCMQGICNSVRLNNVILNMSNLHELETGSEDWTREKTKNHNLETICGQNALDVAYFNLSEFLKGGAVLSCLVMHLNRQSYKTPLL